MPRTIAPSLLENMFSPSPTDGIRWLLDVAWNDGVNVGEARAALHDQNVTSNGNVYLAAAFGIGLPDENSEASMLRLTVQDVDMTLRTELRKLDPRYPATATLRPMLISDPNTLALAPYAGPLRNVKIGRAALAASVETFRNLSREPAVQWNMTPSHGFNALRAR